MKTIELTDEQLKSIAHALKTNIRVNQESIDRMYEVCGENEHTRETAYNIVSGNMCLRTLLNYI
jgi:oligoribonuclease (3'-5' exoribonuclease)